MNTRAKLKKQLTEDIRYRTITFAILSLVINLLYGIYNGILGYLSHSYWFKAMCAYHLILGIMRFCAILTERKKDLKKEHRVAKLTGCLLSFLSLILAGIVYMSLSQDIATKYGEIVMITIAAYTFYKITMAIIRFVKYRKESSPVMSAIRCIGYAEISVSVFTMQMSMLVSFGEMSNSDIYIFNLLTGIGVCAFTLMLGILMIKKGVKNNGKIKVCKSK